MYSLKLAVQLLCIQIIVISYSSGQKFKSPNLRPQVNSGLSYYSAYLNSEYEANTKDYLPSTIWIDEENYNEPEPEHYYPYYLRDIFSFKSYIHSVARRLDEGREVLDSVGDFTDEYMTLLDQLKMLLESVKNETEWCPDGAFSSGRKCYLYLKDAKTFKDAKEDCLLKEGILAVPSFKPESTFGNDLKASSVDIIENTKVWLNGEGMGTMVQMANGYQLPTDGTHPSYRFPVGYSFPGVNDKDFLYLVVPLIGQKWTVELSTNENEVFPYVCELKRELRIEESP